MEKEITSALIAVGGTIIGAIIVYISTKKTTKTNFTMWYKDYSEKYQKLTFEKRLQAHQEAFYWIQKLNSVLNIAPNLENRQEAQEKIWKVTTEAREWWDKHALYLDENSRRLMVGAINRSAVYFVLQEENMVSDVWQHLDKTKKALLHGIGKKYLPDAEDEDRTIFNNNKYVDYRKFLIKRF